MEDTVEDFKEYFWFCGAFRGRTHIRNVSTRTRKQFMLENPRNKVCTNQGEWLDVQWKNLGGGVWQAVVDIPNC